MRAGGDFVSGTCGVKGKAHGGITLPPTLREKAAKDGAPPVRFAIGRLGHPPGKDAGGSNPFRVFMCGAIVVRTTFHVEHGKYVRTSRGRRGQGSGAQKAKILEPA